MTLRQEWIGTGNLGTGTLGTGTDTRKLPVPALFKGTQLLFLDIYKGKNRYSKTVLGSTFKKGTGTPGTGAGTGTGTGTQNMSTYSLLLWEL